MSKDKEKQKASKQAYDEKRIEENGKRYKTWTMIFYPDSAPAEWDDMLSDMNMRIWVSPLHDSDCWTAADEKRNSKHIAGTLKKPHYHLIAQYEVQVDMGTFVTDFMFLNATKYVKNVKSIRSMVRYLGHLDDPKKAQYDMEDVRTYGGAELDMVEQMGTHERHEALKAMRAYIRAHNIRDFCDFVDYCDDCESGWARLLDDNSSYVIEKYIKSRRYKLMEEAGAKPHDT